MIYYLKHTVGVAYSFVILTFTSITRTFSVFVTVVDITVAKNTVQNPYVTITSFCFSAPGL
jgi:hypothetical protein